MIWCAVSKDCGVGLWGDGLFDLVHHLVGEGVGVGAVFVESFGPFCPRFSLFFAEVF